MARPSMVAVILFAMLGAATAQPPVAPPPRIKWPVVTRVYDLKRALGARPRSLAVTDTNAVIKLILESIPLGDLKPGTDGPQLIERENNTLEVRAAENVQGEVKDLIAALVRLADLAVDIKADVVELDVAAFEKLRQVLPRTTGKPDSPIIVFRQDDEGPTPEEEKAIEGMNKFLKAGKLIQTSTTRFPNGREAVVSARRSTRTYYAYQPVGKRPDRPPQVLKDGFSLLALPKVSTDRRFIRMKLTEQSSVVTRITQQNLGVVAGDKPLVLTSPTVEDFGRAGSGVVADGGMVLFKLDYAPKDKVWVVVLHPTIFIQAEDDELRKQGK